MAESSVDQNEVIRYRLREAMLSGANWFFWIAGLSFINTIIARLEGGWTFVMGLGFTQVIDVIASLIEMEIGSEYATIVLLANLAIDLVVIGIFVVFGILARHQHRWAFIAGMVLYALDALLVLWLEDYLALAFHAFALFGIYKGLAALRKIKAMDRVIETPSVFTQA
jgi:hypothetical protein